MPKIITTKSFITAAQKVHPHYDYSKTVYISALEPVSVICPKHGKFEQLPYVHLRHECRKCGREKGAALHFTGQDKFIAKAKRIHPDYDYSDTIFNGMKNEVSVRCPKHGEFSQIAYIHIKQSGCPVCGREKLATSLSFSLDEFIAKANEVHSNRYSYVGNTYKNQRSVMIITCPDHGKFQQRAAGHLMGSGCPTCAGNERYGLEGFISRAKEIHNTAYDYSKVVYVNAETQVVIGCKLHGEFKQKPGEHLTGRGCAKCGRKRLSIAKTIKADCLIRKSIEVHGNTYTYPLTQQDGIKNKAVIICAKHGEFSPSWENHIRNQSGCPKCSNNVSKGEFALAEWIKGLGIEIEQRNRTLIKPSELDIVIPSKHLAIEYNGDYWHSADIRDRSSPEVRNKHYDKMLKTKAAGYRLMMVWESDWQNRPSVVKHWIQHQLGLSPKICGAREGNLKIATSAESAAFYTKYHLQGPSSSGTHFGLYFNQELAALLTMTQSAVDRKTKTIEGLYWLSRFALAGSVPGAASKLFKFATDSLQAKEVVTYSDSSYALGGVYSKLGFTEDGQIKPDYRVWHMQYGIRHKSFWQRKAIPKRIDELNLDIKYDPDTDPRTEYEMCDLLECRHVWDAGKVKWIWKQNQVIKSTC